jgi:hypothetical protein
LLTFIGVDPGSGNHESPTVWVDETNHELVLQGWKPDRELAAQCEAFIAPGHAPGIPVHETVIRLPARMVSMVRTACDALEVASRSGGSG